MDPEHERPSGPLSSLTIICDLLLSGAGNAEVTVREGRGQARASRRSPRESVSLVALTGLAGAPGVNVDGLYVKVT